MTMVVLERLLSSSSSSSSSSKSVLFLSRFFMWSFLSFFFLDSKIKLEQNPKQYIFKITKKDTGHFSLFFSISKKGVRALAWRLRFFITRQNKERERR